MSNTPIETKQLGPHAFTANMRVLMANVQVNVYADDVPFDGDDPEDIAAFERGDFHMYFVTVTAYFAGHVSGSDALGGIAARTEDEIIECVEQHGMVLNALKSLAENVEHVVKEASK